MANTNIPAFPSAQDGFGGVPGDMILPFAVDALENLVGPDSGVASVLAQTVPDFAATSSLTCTAGTIFVTRVWVPKNVTVTNVSFITAATAASTPTNWWVFVATKAGVIQGISADQLTTAIAADTLFTVALATPYVDTTGVFRYVGIMVAATTGPTIAASVTLGTHGRGAVVTTSKSAVIAASCDTGKTTPPAVGSTLGTLPLGSASVAPGLFYIS